MIDLRMRERSAETHKDRPAQERLRTSEREAMIAVLCIRHAAYIRQPRQHSAEPRRSVNVW